MAIWSASGPLFFQVYTTELISMINQHRSCSDTSETFQKHDIPSSVLWWITNIYTLNLFSWISYITNILSRKLTRLDKDTEESLVHISLKCALLGVEVFVCPCLLKRGGGKSNTNPHCHRRCPWQALYKYCLQKRIWPDSNKTSLQYTPLSQERVKAERWRGLITNANSGVHRFGNWMAHQSTQKTELKLNKTDGKRQLYHF